MKSHVILIDDNPVDNILHEQMLRNFDENIEISIIDNSRLALKFLEQEFSKKSLEMKTTIFLDEIMPQMRGVEIMESLENMEMIKNCLLYTSDAADDMQCVDLGGRRIIKKLD